MSKNKVVDIKKLDGVFGIDTDSEDLIDEITAEIARETDQKGDVIDIVAVASNEKIEEQKTPTQPLSGDLSPIEEEARFVNDELKTLLKTSNEMMSAAKYLIDSCPDAETIASASGMIASIARIISEFNRSVMLGKRFNYQVKLEQIKFEQKEKILKLRAAQDQKKLIMGDGNTINIQQNNLIPFSQESIIRKLLDEEKKNQ